MSPENQMLDESDVPQLGLEELTADNLETSCPGVYTQLRERFRTEGQQTERQRIEALVKGCHGNGGRLIEAFASDQAAAEIEKLNCDELAGKRDKLAAENQQLRADIENRRAAQFDDRQLEEHFAQTQDLQDRFSCANAYIAYLRHAIK